MDGPPSPGGPGDGRDLEPGQISGSPNPQDSGSRSGNPRDRRGEGFSRFDRGPKRDWKRGKSWRDERKHYERPMSPGRPPYREQPPVRPGGWRRDDFPRNRPSMMAGRWNRPPAHYDNPYDDGPPRFDDRGPPPEFEHGPPYPYPPPPPPYDMDPRAPPPAHYDRYPPEGPPRFDDRGPPPEYMEFRGGPPPFPPPPYDMHMRGPPPPPPYRDERDRDRDRDRDFDGPPPPPPYRDERDRPPRDSPPREYFQPLPPAGPPSRRGPPPDEFDSRGGGGGDRRDYHRPSPGAGPSYPPPPPAYPPPPLPPPANAPLPPPEPIPPPPREPGDMYDPLSMSPPGSPSRTQRSVPMSASLSHSLSSAPPPPPPQQPVIVEKPPIMPEPRPSPSPVPQEKADDQPQRKRLGWGRGLASVEKRPEPAAASLSASDGAAPTTAVNAPSTLSSSAASVAPQVPPPAMISGNVPQVSTLPPPSPIGYPDQGLRTSSPLPIVHAGHPNGPPPPHMLEPSPMRFPTIPLPAHYPQHYMGGGPDASPLPYEAMPAYRHSGDPFDSEGQLRDSRDSLPHVASSEDEPHPLHRHPSLMTDIRKHPTHHDVTMTDAGAPAKAEATKEPELPEPPKNLPKRGDLLAEMERLDGDIGVLEHELTNLKAALSRPKKQRSLLDSHKSLMERVYDENREKAAASVEPFAQLGVMIPSEKGPERDPALIAAFANLVQIRDHHLQIRESMRAVLRQRAEAVSLKEQKLIGTYKRLHDSWRKRLQERKRRLIASGQMAAPKPKPRAHQSPARAAAASAAAAAAAARAAVTSGRNSSSSRRLLSDAVRSEAELEQILSQLREEEAQDPARRYVRTLAPFTTMILDKKQRHKQHFLDNNGIIEDMKEHERRRKETNPWIEEERRVFLEKYLQFPKRFRKIAEFLPNKTTGDVIAFYYLNKRNLNLKKKLREHMASSRRRSSAGRTEYVLVPREQGTPKQRPPSGLPRELANLGVSAEFWGASGAGAPQSRQRPTNNSRSAARLPADDDSDAEDRSSEEDERTPPQALPAPAAPTPSQAQRKERREREPKVEREREPPREVKQERKKEREPKDDSPRLSVISSASPPRSPQRRASPVPRRPVVAPSPLKDKDDGVQAEGSGPVRWTEEEKEAFTDALITHQKDWRAIAERVQTKTPAQCKQFFINYRKRLGLDDLVPADLPAPPGGNLDDDPEPKTPRGTWTTQEKEDFVTLYKAHGRNWRSIANALETKTANQVKHYFQSNRHRLNLPPVPADAAEKAGNKSDREAEEGGAPEPKRKKQLAVSLTSPPPSATEKDSKKRKPDPTASPAFRKAEEKALISELSLGASSDAPAAASSVAPVTTAAAAAAAPLTAVKQEAAEAGGAEAEAEAEAHDAPSRALATSFAEEKRKPKKARGDEGEDNEISISGLPPAPVVLKAEPTDEPPAAQHVPAHAPPDADAQMSEAAAAVKFQAEEETPAGAGAPEERAGGARRPSLATSVASSVPLSSSASPTGDSLAAPTDQAASPESHAASATSAQSAAVNTDAPPPAEAAVPAPGVADAVMADANPAEAQREEEGEAKAEAEEAEAQAESKGEAKEAEAEREETDGAAAAEKESATGGGADVPSSPAAQDSQPHPAPASDAKQ